MIKLSGKEETKQATTSPSPIRDSAPPVHGGSFPLTEGPLLEK
jgi:hypothetical protein